jgi:hypothetical protein
MQGIASVAPEPGKQNEIPLSPEQKRELVQRVINSQAFCRAAAMRSFLSYITEHAILERPQKLKEQTIGTEVLGRKPDYDPADDNIVRVRAHELRGRLENYFTSEGSEEPVIINLPRGTYVPEFVPRATLTVERPAPQAKSGAPAQSEAKQAEPGPPQAAKVPRWYWLLLAGCIVAAIVMSVAVSRYAMRQESPTVSAGPSGEMRDFWGQFFPAANEELKVVYADPSFALWQDLNKKTLGLGDYINRTFLNFNNKFFNVAMRRVTSTADMAIAAHLAALATEFHGRETPQFARDADPDFFHHGNVVLIGSHRSNPWVEMYEPGLNFELEQDPHTGAPAFVNRAPRAGEAREYTIPAMYDTQTIDEKTYTSYAVIALLKGCGTRGFTVLLDGLNTQATQAAGDLITDPQRLELLLRSIGHKPETSVEPFEALIQMTSVPGGYDNPEVVAYRIRSSVPCTGE